MKRYSILHILALPLILWLSIGLFSPNYTGLQLVGAEEIQDSPEFQWSQFLSGTFQNSFEKWYQQIGFFRGLLVQIENSINFYFFSQTASGSNIVKGKQDVLFYRQDLDFYNQERHLGEKDKRNIELIKKIQVGLLERKQLFVPVVIPSKSTVSRLSISESWKVSAFSKGDSIYRELIEEFRKNEIFFVDGREILLRLQEEKNINVFPRFARHWSRVSTCLVFQKILVEFKRLKIEIPGHNCTGTASSIANYPEDVDLLNLLNIFEVSDRKIDSVSLPQLSLHFDSTKNLGRNDFLIVGTSFGFFFQFEALRSGLFKNPYLFYYNNTIFDGSRHSFPLKPKSKEWNKIVQNSALIVIDLFETFLPYMHESFLAQIHDELNN